MKFICLFLFLISINALAQEVRCPQYNKSKSKGEAPVFSSETKDKIKLLICGIAEGSGEKAIYSDFKIYSHNGSKHSDAVMEAGSNEPYWVKPSDQGLILEELKFVKGEYYPFYKHEILCKGSDCKKLGRVCVFKKLKAFPTEVLSEIKTYAKGANEKKMPADFLITELRDLALTGNKKAQEIFEKKPGFRLEEESLEEFNNAKDLIVKLKKSNCLK